MKTTVSFFALFIFAATHASEQELLLKEIGAIQKSVLDEIKRAQNNVLDQFARISGYQLAIDSQRSDVETLANFKKYQIERITDARQVVATLKQRLGQ